MNRNNLRIHFVHRHVWDTVVILEEGNRPHPHCPRCDMFVPWGALNGCHPTMALCRRGEGRKFRILTVEEAWAGTERAFKAYGHPLIMVLYFK